eukprot:m.104075 g.104075  ORF g.104075 m.104075 type:complete len:441 (+) comp37200_c0_seq17:135-1457(+)
MRRNGRAVEVPDDSTALQIDPEEILRASGQKRCNHVYEIDLQGKKIRRIRALDSFTRVRSLNLSCNKIRQMENLEKNNGLKELKIHSNEIDAIEGLDRLKDLSHLMLHHNNIECIGMGLKSLSKLQLLRLDYNRLAAISRDEIVPLSQLTHLDVSNNRIAKIEGLSALANLEELNLRENKLVAVPDMTRCKKVRPACAVMRSFSHLLHLMQLQEIDLSGNCLERLADLAFLPHLLTLRLESLSLTSVGSIGRLKSLQNFYVADNELSDVQAIADQLPSLEMLDIRCNAIESAKSFSSFACLTDLYVEGNPCSKEANYRAEIAEGVSCLELVDGVQVQSPKAGNAGLLPLMRPMTATTVLSSRQIEAQLSALDIQMESYRTSLDAKLGLLTTSLSTLSDEPPEPEHDLEIQSSGRPSTRSSSRAKIQEAKAFASKHFQQDS